MKKIKNITYTYIFILFFAFSSFLAYSQEVIIQNGDQWSYFDKGYLEGDWYKNQNYQNWKTGKSPLGYVSKLVTTPINPGNNQENEVNTKYFSKRITITDLSKFKGFEFKLQKDDGAVIYVNGKELYRDNMPDGHITKNTRPIKVINTEEEESLFNVKFFDSSVFTSGINTISARVDQSNSYYSDCLFSLEIIGHTDLKILTKVVKEQIKTENPLESKIQALSYNFILRSTALELEINKNQYQNLFILLIVVSILLIITIIGAFTLYFKNRNSEEVLQNRIQKLNYDVIENEKKMISSSTQLLHYKQYLKEVKADLKFLKTDDNKALNNTIKRIDFIIENNDEWEQLKLHFDTVFSGFYDYLFSKCPTLTETELRHCMFIKLHIQTKEIAKILNIDPRSVQTARYRIKKKLDLTEQDDLRNFLITI